MRFRVSSIIFGLSLTLATLILLYQVWNLPNDNNVELRKKENIAYLESRVKQLEEDIHMNHETIREIKVLIKSLSTSENGLRLLLDSPDAHKANTNNEKVLPNKFDRSWLKNVPGNGNIHQPLFNFSKAAVQPDDCIFCQSTPSTVDIQMKEVLDIIPFDNPDGGVWKQGWKIEYDVNRWKPENKLKVFVVPHSHNDPGWIKTFEKYFEDQTKHILDNMVIKLSEDHRRKFIWAEISFFTLWWDQQSMETKDKVKRNGWSIDPFGYSPTFAYILKRSGLKNMLIQRTHYSIKKHFSKEKNLEFRWRQIWDGHSSTDILCHMMPFYSYDVPHTCGPDPKVCCQFDFRRLPGSGVTCPWRIAPQPITDNNVEPKARLLLDQYRKKAELYRTNVLLIPLGDDFRYDRSTEWDDQFVNYQKLFDYMNSQESLHVEAQFGTLSDYFNALREVSGNGRKNEEEFFPSLSGDFFAYADRDQHYWSGYYTSRPFYKRMDRIMQFYLRSAEMLFSLMLETETHSGWSRKQQEIVYSLMDNLVRSRMHHALFQHHDGITGTSKNHVVVDYANKLLSSLKMCQHIIQQAVHSLLSKNQISENSDESSTYFDLGERFTEYNNIAEKTVYRVSRESPFTVYVFNSDAHKRQQLLTLRIDTPFVEVLERSGDLILCQVDPVFNLQGELHPTEFDLHFVVSLDSLSVTGFTINVVEPSDVKKMTYTSFSQIELRHMTKPNLPEIFTATVNDKEESIFLKNGRLTANFSSLGLLQSFSSNGVSSDVNLNFIKYDGGHGGAYLFLPKGTGREVRINPKPIIIVKGQLQSYLTIHQHNFVHQVKLRNSPGVDGLALHIDNYVDIKNERNIEIGIRLKSDIKNENTFYTDLNGFQIIKRTKYDKLPIQGNYYPVATQIFIEDESKRLTLHTASPLGGSSLQSGSMEVILDRQLTQDDERGLGHGVHDNVLTLNSFSLLLEPRSKPKEATLVENIPAGYASLTSHYIDENYDNSFGLINYDDNDGLSELMKRESVCNFSFEEQLYKYHEISLKNEVLHSLQNNGYAKHWNIGGELPCDIEMVNLRSLLATKQPGAPHPPSSTMALTLHRFGFSCFFPNIGLSCSTSNGKVRLSDLFPATFSEDVKQMSLSHLYEGVDMGKSYSLSFQPMELYSFKLFISSPN
ncbi:Alpha-mannosidase 2 [Armadillidium nasatum]|uniref:Alpha-mannosidase n=1 Tax=Armadillidium nasatum TaxID=96803 RepID=A0A5N5T1E9_9CRUS|nr:Alpha-mannosidase 2 [Armadillidium nasatum]